MTATRASALMAAGVSLLTLTNPATAQVDEGIVLEIMRQCARIDDATARLACYDNNIRSSSGEAMRRSVPGTMETPRGGSGAPLESGGATGFGRESIRTPDRFETPAGEIDELAARVRSVSERERGVYLMTLEDGAQWLFSESVDFSYRPPRAGSTIEISRGALGGFLMRFDEQRSIRVRRIR